MRPRSPIDMRGFNPRGYVSWLSGLGSCSRVSPRRAEARSFDLRVFVGAAVGRWLDSGGRDGGRECTPTPVRRRCRTSCTRSASKVGRAAGATLLLSAAPPGARERVWCVCVWETRRTCTRRDDDRRETTRRRRSGLRAHRRVSSRRRGWGGFVRVGGAGRQPCLNHSSEARGAKTNPPLCAESRCVRTARIEMGAGARAGGQAGAARNRRRPWFDATRLCDGRGAADEPCARRR